MMLTLTEIAYFHGNQVKTTREKDSKDKEQVTMDVVKVVVAIMGTKQVISNISDS